MSDRVTHVLTAAGLIDPSKYTYADEARERGSAVHKALAYLAQNDLDWDSVDDSYRPYVEAGAKFLDEHKPEVLAVEEEVRSDTLGIVGHLDLRGVIRWAGRPLETLADYKTGAPEAWHKIQLAGYAVCFRRYVRRVGVQLKPNGKYVLHPYEDEVGDEDTFRAAVTLMQWRRREGLWVPSDE